ncbi:MAG: hypothetical protein DRQ78_03230 [Epsilonproteobacteria bacterium]|nr:MAG: hypothetical protein DRQ78_03230 [Campylobacterota bacterium]
MLNGNIENEILDTNKEEALRQISEIKSHLVDKQTFFPYNYTAMYVWSVISVLMTFLMIPMYEVSVLQGTFVSFVLISFGFISEGFMTKKANQSYDIEDCTLRQQFIMKNFVMLSLFAIVMSAVLASYKLYVPMFLTWLFLISFGFFAIGFVLNIERFTKIAKFNVFSSILLLGIGYLNHTLVGSTHTYVYVVQIFMVLGLGVMPAMTAWQQKRDGC